MNPPVAQIITHEEKEERQTEAAAPGSRGFDMSLIGPLLNAVGRQLLNVLVAPQGVELAAHQSMKAHALRARGQDENTSVIVRGDAGATAETRLLVGALTHALEADEKERGAGYFEEILGMSGMSGRKYRRLINRMISLASAPRYLEVGSWAGSTACSAIHGNRVEITCIDNWSEFGGPKDVFLANVAAASNPGVAFSFIESDFRKADFGAIGPFNVYLFDGPHSRQDQYDGVRLAQPALADTFVLIVDDWNWDQVRSGTFDAITDEKLRLHLSVEIRTTRDNSHALQSMEHSDWHNGYFLCVCRKPRARN